MSHTPGPWSLEVHESSFDGVSVGWSISSDTRVNIANGQAQEHLGKSGILRTECIANAHLIVAAPTMLAALRRAALALSFAAEESTAMRDDYEAISAVIEEATGAAQ